MRNELSRTRSWLLSPEISQLEGKFGTVCDHMTIVTGPS